MVEKKVTVQLKGGLQARPAAMFVQEANRFSADIFIKKNDTEVNAKSIMGIMSLAISFGTELTIIADGSDEREAITALEEFVSKDT